MVQFKFYIETIQLLVLVIKSSNILTNIINIKQCHQNMNLSNPSHYFSMDMIWASIGSSNFHIYPTSTFMKLCWNLRNDDNSEFISRKKNSMFKNPSKNLIAISTWIYRRGLIYLNTKKMYNSLMFCKLAPECNNYTNLQKEKKKKEINYITQNKYNYTLSKWDLNLLVLEASICICIHWFNTH